SSDRPLPGSAFGRGTAARRLLPRGAQSPASRARRRADGKRRRRTRPRHPGGAARARPRTGHHRHRGDAPRRGDRRGRPGAAAPRRKAQPRMRSFEMKIHTTVWMVCVMLLLACPARAQDDDRTRVFDAPLDRVWTVARSTLRGLGWDIDQEDRAVGWIRTDSRRMEGEDYGVYAKGVKHRLRLLFKSLADGKTMVTIEHPGWKEERILWMDKKEDVPTTDTRVEKEIFDAIGATL